MKEQTGCGKETNKKRRPKDKRTWERSKGERDNKSEETLDTENEREGERERKSLRNKERETKKRKKKAKVRPASHTIFLHTILP